MAKLSLWLVTLAKGRPFTFLDHALKWGDAIAKRRKLESFSINGIEDLQEKERLFQEAEQAIAQSSCSGLFCLLTQSLVPQSKVLPRAH